MFFSSNRSDLCLQPKPKHLPFKSGDYCLITYFEHLSCIYIMQAENDEAFKFRKESDLHILAKTAKGESMLIKVFLPFLYYVCCVSLLQKCPSLLSFLPISLYNSNIQEKFQKLGLHYLKK